MAQTFNGRRRVRKFFGDIREVAEMSNLIDEIQSRIVIPPIAVIEVTSDQNESDFLFDCQVDEITQRTSCGIPNFLDGRTVILFQPA